MEGRWTIHYVEDSDVRANAAVSGPAFGGGREDLSVPVVPCDDAAIERAAQALYPHVTGAGYSEEGAKALVIHALRAAGATMSAQTKEDS